MRNLVEHFYLLYFNLINVLNLCEVEKLSLFYEHPHHILNVQNQVPSELDFQLDGM